MTVPAGWYPDPSGPGQRYFNGWSWTGDTHIEPRGVTVPRRFTVHYGFVVLAMLAIIGTVVPCAGFFGSASEQASDPDSAGYGVAMLFGFGWALWGGMWILIWTAFAIQHTLRGRQ